MKKKTKNYIKNLFLTIMAFGFYFSIYNPEKNFIDIDKIFVFILFIVTVSMILWKEIKNPKILKISRELLWSSIFLFFIIIVIINFLSLFPINEYYSKSWFFKAIWIFTIVFPSLSIADIFKKMWDIMEEYGK